MQIRSSGSEAFEGNLSSAQAKSPDRPRCALDLDVWDYVAGKLKSEPPTRESYGVNLSRAANEAVDSLMRTLLSNPYRGLDVSLNSVILRVLENYRLLKEETEHLQAERDTEVRQLRQLLSEWQRDRQDFKEEVKRVEVILAHVSKRGTAEVTLARHHSKVRWRDTDSDLKREDLFRYLEGTTTSAGIGAERRQQGSLARVPDGAFNRAVLKSSASSPDLTDKKPKADRCTTTRPEAQGRDKSTSASEATIADSRHDSGRAPQTNDDTTAASEEGEWLEFQRLARSIGQRQNLDMARIMPRLLQLFEAPGHDRGRSWTMLNTKRNASSSQPAVVSSSAQASAASMKRQSVVAKASGLFNRLKPHGDLEAARRLGPSYHASDVNLVGTHEHPFPRSPTLGLSRHTPRKFSFEAGVDDAESMGASRRAGLAPNPEGLRGMRKSISLSSLADLARTTHIPRHLRSPPSQSSASSRHHTRIPTPIKSPGSLARARSVRHGSIASFVTVIERSQGAGSEHSPVPDPSPSMRPEVSETKPQVVNAETGSSNTGSGKLVSRANSLRRSDVGITSARGKVTQKPGSASSAGRSRRRGQEQSRDPGDENVRSAPSNTRSMARKDSH